jgi:hypothetical protein
MLIFPPLIGPQSRRSIDIPYEAFADSTWHWSTSVYSCHGEELARQGTVVGLGPILRLVLRGLCP